MSELRQTEVKLNNKFTLNDKYTLLEGRIILSGIQALVRLLLDQNRADLIKGINTGTLVSGYRGSPVGMLDINLVRNKKLLDQHNINFIPGVNEDLGATLIYGSQMAGMVSNVKYDGVLGMWYGKAPGVDRSGDIFRHANFLGVGKNGGVLAVAGDDPSCKSSTLPSQSEPALFDAMMPIFYPGNVQEILDLGRYAYEMSRYSGLWSGFKIVTDIADAFGSAIVHPERININIPDFQYNGQPWKHTQNAKLVGHHSLPTEKEIHLGRIEAAKHFLTSNNINKITIKSDNDSIGIITAGKTYYDIVEALDSLGWDEAFLNEKGIRILKLGATFPVDSNIIKQFTENLNEVFVIEEKRSFVEMLIKEEVYNYANKPLIIGKTDEHNNPLIPGYGELTADDLSKIIFKRYASRLEVESDNNKINIISEVDNRVYGESLTSRSMYFCSGCPHNTSTVKLPEGDSAFGGIGCHLMAMFVINDGVTSKGQKFIEYFKGFPAKVESVLDSIKARDARTVQSNYGFSTALSNLSLRFNYPEDDQIINRDGIKEDWLYYNYEKFPLVASLSKFTKIQSDIRSVEYEILNSLVSKTKDRQLSFDSKSTLLETDKQAYYTNSTVDAKVVVGNTDSSFKPDRVDLMVDNIQLKQEMQELFNPIMVFLQLSLTSH
jgi:indolepyruvate ferredoxin oxidoreductase